MTLEKLIKEAQKLIEQGVSPKTKVYIKNDQGETDHADTISVWKVASLKTWCSGNVLDEKAEEVVTVG